LFIFIFVYLFHLFILYTLHAAYKAMTVKSVKYRYFYKNIYIIY